MKYERYRGFSLIPPGRRKNNPRWLAMGRIRERAIELSTGAVDLDGARGFVDRMVGAVAGEPVGYWLTPGDRLPPWGIKLWHAARERALTRELPFTLTKDELAAIIVRANGRCEVTGLPFSRGRVRGCRRQPYVASLDRIKPADGYAAGNCRLVCYAVNVALSDWGPLVLKQIALAIGAKSGEISITA